MGVTEIQIGASVHSTRCFLLKKQSQIEEISYLKTVDCIFQRKREDRGAVAREAAKFQSIIDLLVKIVQIHPLSQQAFLQQMKASYPYRKASEDALFLYQLNIYKIAMVRL